MYRVVSLFWNTVYMYVTALHSEKSLRFDNAVAITVYSVSPTFISLPLTFPKKLQKLKILKVKLVTLPL